MLNVKTLLVVGVPLVVVLYFLNAYVGFVGLHTFNPYKSAMGQLAMAETAQTSIDVIKHVKEAKAELSNSGYVDWWPTKKDRFDSILIELDDIVARATGISSLESQNEKYISEMYYIHDRIELIEQTLAF